MEKLTSRIRSIFSASSKRKVERPQDIEFPYLPRDKNVMNLGKIKRTDPWGNLSLNKKSH